MLTKTTAERVETKTFTILSFTENCFYISCEYQTGKLQFIKEADLCESQTYQNEGDFLRTEGDQ